MIFLGSMATLLHCKPVWEDISSTVLMLVAWWGGSTLLWVPPPALLTHPGSICTRFLIAALRQDLGHATKAGICSSACWPGEAEVLCGHGDG